MGIITGTRIPRGRLLRALRPTAALVGDPDRVRCGTGARAPAHRPRRLADIQPRPGRHALFHRSRRSTAATSARCARSGPTSFIPRTGSSRALDPTDVFQQVTPIVVDGVMYLAAGNRVMALRPETGEEIWRHELTEGLVSYRGVTYWPGSGEHGPRIFFTSLWKVVALDARTGERDPMFGNQGEVEVRVPYAGVPVVSQDILVLGSNAYGPGESAHHASPQPAPRRGRANLSEPPCARRQDGQAPLGVSHHPSGKRLR